MNKANNMNQSLFNKTIKKEEGVKMCKGKQEGADEWSLSRISRDLCRFSITAFNQVHSMQCSNLSWPFKKGGGRENGSLQTNVFSFFFIIRLWRVVICLFHLLDFDNLVWHQLVILFFLFFFFEWGGGGDPCDLI